jgi:hypothetical protein
MIYVLVEEQDRLCMVLVKDLKIDQRLDGGHGLDNTIEHQGPSSTMASLNDATQGLLRFKLQIRESEI